MRLALVLPILAVVPRDTAKAEALAVLELPTAVRFNLGDVASKQLLVELEL
jgi:hypothetical protein